jgi:polyisoprenyl-phosphate glycosyltransferase
VLDKQPGEANMNEQPQKTDAERKVFLSIVTAAYNEQDNLPVLYERIKKAVDNLGVDWEWVIIDDHSEDETFKVIDDISRRDPRIHGTRLARNSGAHIALTCGLHRAKGDCTVTLAADLQDPPEIIAELYREWLDGSQVVWAVRGKREGESKARVGLAGLYYLVMRKFVGFKDMPATGADFFLLDRRVVDTFCQCMESNVSILALITWLGFRQSYIDYTKEARLYGESGWTLKKNLKLLVDSITSFSYTPVRFMSYFGFIVAMSGFTYATFLVYNALTGDPLQGWTTLIVIILLLGGLQMLMMGVLGEYLWRTLDESRRRPRFIIEQTTDSEHVQAVWRNRAKKRFLSGARGKEV